MSAGTSKSTTRDSSQSRDGSDVEKAESLPNHSASPQSALFRHFDAEVSSSYVDIPVLLCWFTTGFLDSTIFNAYRTFVSMQTGNTIFIGLGASHNPLANRPYGWLKSLLSLITFLLGCLFFARLSVRMGPSRRLTLVSTFAIQTFLLLLAAILVQTGIVESRLEYLTDDIDWRHLIPIFLLSFQAPGQTCMGRALGLWEVPTVVVTTMIYDFASDDDLFVARNARRNRRLAGFVFMLVGAVVGGAITNWTRHIAASLWSVCVIKAGITLAWVVWPRRRLG